MENVPLRDLLWRVCFRRKLRPLPGDRRHHLRDRGTSSRWRTPVSGLLPTAGLRWRDAIFRQGAFGFDATRMNIAVPRDSPCDAARPNTPRKRWSIAPRLRPATRARQSPVHGERPWSHVHRLVLRRLPGQGPRLPRDRGVPESDAQTPGLGRALFAEAKEWHGLRRLRLRGLLNANIQGLLMRPARTSSASWPRPAGAGVMPPVAASWPCHGSSMAPTPPLLMTYPAGDRSTDELDLVCTVTATPTTGDFSTAWLQTSESQLLCFSA